MKNVKNLKPADASTFLGVTAVVAAIGVPLNGIVGWVSALLVGTLATIGYRVRMAEFQTRVEAKEGGQWSVEIDGISVALLDDRQYAMTCLSVYGDVRLHVKQLLALSAPFIKMVEILLKTIPAVTFWVVLAMLLVSPNTMQETLVELSKINAADLAQFIKATGPGLFMFYALLMLAIGAVRFHNVFDEVIAYRVRRHTGITANGRMSLVKRTMKDGTLFIDVVDRN